MGRALLWIEHLAFVTLLFAALLAWIARAREPRRTVLLVFAAGVPLALHALLAGSTIALRFDDGVAHSPWVFATSAFCALVVGFLALARRGLRGEPPRASSWPLGALALAAGLALLLDGMTFWNLGLGVRQRMSALQVEAGLLAFSVTPAPPLEAENAAPKVERALAEWRAAEGELIPEPAWIEAASDETRGLELAGPRLVAWLERAQPWLERLRAAAELPRYAVLPRGAEQGWIGTARFLPELLDGARALGLDAQVRALDGDLEGCWRDLRAVERLARHQLEQPTLIGLMVAVALRRDAIRAAAAVLGSGELTALELEGFPFEPEPRAGDSLPRAVAMEEAFGLSALSRFGAGSASVLAAADAGEGLEVLDRSTAGEVELAVVEGDGGGLFESLSARLYEVFLLEGDLAGYRASLRELRALASMPADELAGREPDHARLRARGSIAVLVTPNAWQLFPAVHRGDAELALVCAAEVLARHRIRAGEWPAVLGELEADERAALPAALAIQRDGTALVLTLTDFPAGGDGSPRLRIGR